MRKSIIFLIFIIVLGMSNSVNAATKWIDKVDSDDELPVNGSFHGVYKTADDWWGDKYNRPGGNTLKFGAGIEIKNATDAKKRTFTNRAKSPIIDIAKGVFCIEHGIDSGDGGSTPDINGNIIINGPTAYSNWGTSKKKQLTGTKLQVAKEYAYLLMWGREFVPPNPKDTGQKRAKTMVQKTIWKESPSYIKYILGKSPSKDWIDEIEDNATSSKGKNRIKAAKTYSKMNVVTTKVTTFKPTANTWTEKNGKWIVGPFKATFTDAQYEKANGGVRILAGEYKSLVNGRASGDTTWQFCDSTGHVITPRSGQKFYIKINKNLVTKDHEKVTLTFKARRLRIQAEWWDLGSIYGQQFQIFETHAQPDWVTSEDQASYTRDASTTEDKKDPTPDDIKVTKRDSENGKPLAGVKLRIEGIGTYTTDEDGEFIIPASDLPDPDSIAPNGKDYLIYEEDVGKDNWQYKTPSGAIDRLHIALDSEWIVNIITKEVTTTNDEGEEVTEIIEIDNSYWKYTIKKGQEKTVTNQNKKVYTDISGYVWNDEPTEGKETGEGDSKYNSGERAINGVKVTLKDKAGNIVINGDGEPCTMLTAEGENYDIGNGEYLFHRVEIAKLSEYHVEFEYDGLVYQNVPVIENTTPGGEETSKAKEKDRDGFNSGFSEVHGTGSNTGATNRHNLTYEMDDHEAILNSQKSYEDNGDVIIQNETPEGYPIIATTEGNCVLQKVSYDDDEVRNVNLGIYLREQPDLDLVKDVHSVRLAINNYEHTYNYAEAYSSTSASTPSKESDNLGVNFKFQKANGSYTRPIYNSDYNYYYDSNVGNDQNGKDRELTAYVTYKIALRNYSDNDSLDARVNSIVDYFDTDYQLDAIGTGVDGTGRPTGRLADSGTSYSGNGYNKTTITTNMDIGSGKQAFVYIQFKLNHDKIREVCENDKTLNNIAEINSYSIFKNGKVYAGIDRNSNPGNCIPGGDTDEYEDDTDWSKGFKFELRGPEEDRYLSGKVFLDSTTGELKTKEQRLGDGKYGDGDKSISGVTITFEEKSGSTTPTKYLNNDENGEFTILGYIPGNYTVTYTWGNKVMKADANDVFKVPEANNGYNRTEIKEPQDGEAVVTAQRYKGTRVDKNVYTAKSQMSGNKATKWYREDFKQKYTSSNPPEWENGAVRTSDAVDDYSDKNENDTRQEIDKEIEEGRKFQKDEQEEVKEDQEGTNNQIMKSTTPQMGIGVEYYDEPTQGGAKPEYKVRDVDFGIVERARQQLEIYKDATAIKITDSKGTVLIDAEIGQKDGEVLDEKNGTRIIREDISKATKGLTFMGPNQETSGFLKAELDDEIIQDSILQVEYTIKVKNVGEIDYETEDYYKYAIEPSTDDKKAEHIVKIEPKVYDYLDNKTALDIRAGKQDSENWKVIKENEYENKYMKEDQDIGTIMEKFYKENSTDIDGVITQKDGAVDTIYKIIYKEWEGSTLSTRRTKLNNRIILNNAELEKAIAPITVGEVSDFNEQKLCTSTKLSNSQEITFDNDIEVTEVKRTTKSGRVAEVHSSKLYDRAEQIIVTPSTGANKNIIIQVSVGLTALITLGAGVVLIKKKVLK